MRFPSREDLASAHSNRIQTAKARNAHSGIGGGALVSKTQQLKTIREAYSELTMLNLQDGFKQVAEYLFDKNLTAERQHRKGTVWDLPRHYRKRCREALYGRAPPRRMGGARQVDR